MKDEVYIVKGGWRGNYPILGVFYSFEGAERLAKKKMKSEGDHYEQKKITSRTNKNTVAWWKAGYAEMRIKKFKVKDAY